MRLTLRTMLAYLDDVLEPADAQELGQKIEESEFATGLVHRIRSSMRRLRLGAPKLEGEGMGLDANSVAEYLDNTLPPDQVPDFEKVCLESDVHLAEVAASHQVLTLVLGEPAEVDPETRERVYGIVKPDAGRQAAGVGPDQQAAEPVPPPKSDISAAAVAAGTEVEPDSPATKKAGRKRPEVPDYLKSDSRLRIWPLVITVLLALLLLGAVLMAVGPRTVLGWLGAGGDTPVANVGGDKQQAAGQPDAVPADAGEDASTAGPDATGDGSGVPADATGLQPEPLVPSATGSGEDMSGGAVAESPAAGPTGGLVGPGESEPAAAGPDPAAAAPAAAVGEGPLPEDEAGDSPAPKAGDDELAKVDPFDRVVGPAAPAEPAPPADVEAASVGRFTSDKEILIRPGAEPGQWFRVPPRGAVNAGDRLLALPTFRPQIMLIGDVQMTLDGSRAAGGLPSPGDPATRATAVQLGPPDESGIPWVQVEYGRLLLITVGKAAAQVGLHMGDLRGVVTFGDADSTAALEVRPYRPPGTDPEAGKPHTIVSLFCTSGAIAWQPAGGEPVRIAAGQVRSFIDTIWAETMDVDALPPWIAGKDIPEMDDQATEVLQPELSGEDVEVSLRLLELAQHRRPEVRSLAIRCGAYLDQFDPFAAALTDAFQKSYWTWEVDVLTEAIQRDAETAALVRQMLEKNRDTDGKSLHRLLWGFSVDDLEDGWDTRLVDYLDHESTDFRVLTIENLRRITGKTLLYRAEFNRERRRPFVQRWRDTLKNGQIQYVVPPLTVPESTGEADAVDTTGTAAEPAPEEPTLP